MKKKQPIISKQTLTNYGGKKEVCLYRDGEDDEYTIKVTLTRQHHIRLLSDEKAARIVFNSVLDCEANETGYVYPYHVYNAVQASFLFVLLGVLVYVVTGEILAFFNTHTDWVNYLVTFISLPALKYLSYKFMKWCNNTPMSKDD